MIEAMGAMVFLTYASLVFCIGCIAIDAIVRRKKVNRYKRHSVLSRWFFQRHEDSAKRFYKIMGDKHGRT